MKTKNMIFLIVVFFLMLYGCVSMYEVNNPDACEKLSGYNQINCYLKVAKAMAKDYTVPVSRVASVCQKIDNNVYEDQCYFSAATYRLLNPNNGEYETFYLCNKMNSRDYKDQCYLFLAVETNDSRYCDYIGGNRWTKFLNRIKRVIFPTAEDFRMDYDYRNMCIEMTS